MTLSKHFGLSETQWPYFRFWLTAIIAVEVLMLVFNSLLFEIYLIIATLFLGGFLLRIFNLYPGQNEPLILDSSAVVLALLFAFFAQWLDTSHWRFLLIFCSSTIVIPHFIYIALEK